MNELVKQLIDQARKNPCGNSWTYANASEYEKQLIEFVVRHCIDNMENCDGDLDFAIWKTKQDFDIE